MRTLLSLCGAVAVEMDAADHDAAVALVSHVPQVAASLVLLPTLLRFGRERPRSVVEERDPELPLVAGHSNGNGAAGPVPAPSWEHVGDASRTQHSGR